MTVADQEIGNNITCSALLSSRIHFHDQQVRVFFPPLDRKSERRSKGGRRSTLHKSHLPKGCAGCFSATMPLFGLSAPSLQQHHHYEAEKYSRFLFLTYCRELFDTKFALEKCRLFLHTHD